MTTNEISYAYEKGITLMWNDPDYVMGNDYRIKSIEVGDDISHICYNGGNSEAEVFNTEISYAPQVVSKKIFKDHSHDTVYGRGTTRKNAFFYGYKDTRWKFMVWAPLDLITKKDLMDEFYNWVILHKPLSDFVRFKIAKNESQMFKIPVSL